MHVCNAALNEHLRAPCAMRLQHAVLVLSLQHMHGQAPFYCLTCRTHSPDETLGTYIT